MSQDKRKEMDHEAKVASQRSDRKTLHALAKVLTVRVQQLEPLLGINKERFLTAKSKRWSGQTTFKKHQTSRNYVKLLTLANKLPALRKTTVKHYTENSPAVFLKLKTTSVTEILTICWDGSKEKTMWLLCKTWGQQSSARKQQNGSMVTIGKKQCLVNWEGLLQCLSQQNRRVSYGKLYGRSTIIWPSRPYVYHINKSKQHGS